MAVLVLSVLGGVLSDLSLELVILMLRKESVVR